METFWGLGVWMHASGTAAGLDARTVVVGAVPGMAAAAPVGRVRMAPLWLCLGRPIRAPPAAQPRARLPRPQTEPQSGIKYPVVVRFDTQNYAGVTTNNFGLEEVEAPKK